MVGNFDVSAWAGLSPYRLCAGRRDGQGYHGPA